MKKLCITTLFLLTAFFTVQIRAQVGINTTGATPHSSAMLDVVSTAKGVLVPRMTSAQRDAIFSPATGLMVYVTTDNNFYYYNGTAWIMIVGGADADWTVSGNDMYASVSGKVGIGYHLPFKKLHVKDILQSTNTVEDIVVIERGSTGTPAAGLGAGLIFYNNSAQSTTSLSGRIASILETIGTGNTSAGMLFQTRPAGGNMTDAVYLDPVGNVGIGTRNPGTRLEITGSAPKLTMNATTSTSPGIVFEENGSTIWNITADYSTDKLNFSSASTTNLFQIDQSGGIDHIYSGSGNAYSLSGNSTAALAFFSNSNTTTGWGLSAGVLSSSAGNSSNGIYGFNYGTGCGIYGKSYHADGTAIYGINTSADNKGYLASPDYGVFGDHHNGAYGFIGGANHAVYGHGQTGNFGYIGGMTYALYGNNDNGNYGTIGGTSNAIYAYLATTEPGNYAIYGYGVHAAGVNGNDYSLSGTMGGIKGFNFYGNFYTFGAAGYTYMDYIRSGGSFGANYTGTVWGCMGYKNSGGTSYGGYFTSYTNGGGKSLTASTGIGLGAWGDLFGADIHGGVYGLFAEGKDYAIYAHGDVYRDGLDVHLQKGQQNVSTPLYTMVSSDAVVQTCGFAILDQGVCHVTFDAGFAAAVSTVEPVVVTVTPHGNCNGVYLEEVSNAGFKLAENNSGRNNVKVSYIAIGKRAGYEKPSLPAAVVASDYVDKVSRGLHNDNDTQNNGEGLYYQGGTLTVGVHPSSLPDPNKPASPQVAEKKPEKPVNRIPDTKHDGRPSK